MRRKLKRLISHVLDDLLRQAGLVEHGWGVQVPGQPLSLDVCIAMVRLDWRDTPADRRRRAPLGRFSGTTIPARVIDSPPRLVYKRHSAMTHLVQIPSLKPTARTAAAWGMDCVVFMFRADSERIPGR